jgi:inorganic phosphate transporter, PiT family
VKQPIAYALNRAMPVSEVAPFVAVATSTQQSLGKYASVAPPADPRALYWLLRQVF